jgi:hypothetical protein
MNETILMDTYRVDPNGATVHCKASVMVNGHDVHLDVIAFGYGREGTEKAFEAMEEVLPAFLGVKWQEVELVRV